MIGELQLGQCVIHRGVIDHVTNEARSLVAVVVPDRYGPEPIDDVPPLPTPYLEPIPVAGDAVRVIEFPGGNLYWLSLAPDAETTSDRAVLWAPLRAILIGVLGMLDDLKSHTHDFGTLKDGQSLPCTGATGGPVETLGYGDARTDTEGDTPKSLRVRVVTSVPRGGA